MAAASNKFAPDPPPTWWLLLRSASDLGASLSWQGRCGGGGDPAVDFAPPVPPSRRRGLRRRRGTREVVQGLAGWRSLRRRRRPWLAVVVLGDLVGCFVATVLGGSLLWFWLCGRLVCGSGGSLRRRRGRGAGPGGVWGVSPATFSNVNGAVRCGSVLWRSIKAASSAIELLQAKGCSSALVGASVLPSGEDGSTGTFRDRNFIFVFLEVVYVKFQGQVASGTFVFVCAWLCTLAYI